MGKKNRNRGSSRGRYDDMFDYAGGNDEDYQYSYQDEIDSAEFVDVENSPKDSRSRETMPPSEKNQKSLAAEERESWDFIKAKMDQSLSRLGTTPASRNNSEKAERSSADPSKEEKEKKPKGPSPIVVFFGKVKSFSSAAFKKIAGLFKRKPKSEKSAEDSGKVKSERKAELSGKNRTDKSAGLSGKDKAEKKPGFAARAFSFLKKKKETATDGAKASRGKNENPSSTGRSAVSRDSKPTPEAQMRERRKTYLIIGSITMSIVLLLLTAGILFFVNRSGKSERSVAQNTETPSQAQTSAIVSSNDGASLQSTTAPTSSSQSKDEGNATDPPSLDSNWTLPDLGDDPVEDPNQTVGDILGQENTTDLSNSLDSLVNESETQPAQEADPAKTQEKEESSEDLLAGLNPLPDLDTPGDESEKSSESVDLPDLASLTDSAPETDPLEAKGSANAPMQEETPSLNETVAQKTDEKDSSSESSPSLLDLPESISPGSTTVSPTISRSEDQNQPPEEMGTPDGVTPGSNIEAWNTPENTEVADSGLSGNSLDLNVPGMDPLNEKGTETGPANDDLTAALAPPAESPSSKPQTKEPKAERNLSDFGQLSDLDSSTAPSLDSDLGSGIPSETIKGQKSAKYANYTSLKDDTFWKISEKFYQTPAYEKALSRYNIDVVPDPNNLKEGTVLQIPDVNFLRSCYPTLCPQPLQMAQVPISQNSDQTRGVQYYCAAEGDTLSLIAERLLGDSSRWPEIYRLNTDKVRNMDLLPAGVKLLIPADDSIPEQNIWQ